MNSSVNPNTFKGFLILILIAFQVGVSGQSLPQIEARFANPAYDRESRNYYLDVELHSKTSPEVLFGLNLRFFYDALKMEFIKVDQFHQGYGILGNAPKPAVGNAQSGAQLFDFTNAAAYINGGVQLIDERFPLQIRTDGWTKAFRLVFKVPVTVFNPENFCPSVIWDIEAGQGQGGFLPGSAGLVITVAETNRNTRYTSKPTVASGVPFNWAYNSTAGLPHGRIQSTDCMRLSELVATEEIGHTDAKGYALFQNQPNPFDNHTIIEFILPKAQNASIILYDVDGGIKEVIEGYYESGKNQVELKQKPWMNQTSVIYYLLKTDTYTSKTFSMTPVRA
jgi:hypothetical protein